MLKQINKIICLIVALFIVYNSSQAQCVNGDVEANNFTNWTGWTTAAGAIKRLNGVLPFNAFVPGIVNNRHTIMNAGNDPLLAGLPTPVLLPKVIEGNHSIRLGCPNNNEGSEAEIIAYTFQVTDPKFYFKYAMVLVDPDHDIQDRPFFRYFIVKGGASLQMTTKFRFIKEKNFIADANNSFFHTINRPPNEGSIVYKEWTTECVDLSAYIGETVTIYFATGDCNFGDPKHFAYAYIDGLCKPSSVPVPDFTYPPYVCIGNAIAVDGSLSQNVTDYYWKLERLSSSSITSVIPGTAVIHYETNAAPGYVPNIFTFKGFRAHHLVRGYYKLTLGVKACNDWIEKSVVIDIDVPEISVNQTVYKCCGDPAPIVFTATTSIATLSGAGIFKWYNAAGVFLGNGTITTIENGSGGYIFQSVFIPPSPDNGAYRVEYIDNNGCRNERWVYVINKTDFTASITSDFCYGYCTGQVTTLTASTSIDLSNYCGIFDDDVPLGKNSAGYTYSWNTGETTQSVNISAHPGVTNYSVTISNGCYSHTVTIDLNDFQILTGPIEKSNTNVSGKILIPNSAHPKSSSPTIFRIVEWGKAGGVRPAYNATSYKLKIANRWGEIVHQQNGSGRSCNGFANGEIYWDCKYKGLSGTYDWVDAGAYSYELEFKNCDNTPVIFKGDVNVIY